MYHLLCWYMHLSLHIANITTSLMSFTSLGAFWQKGWELHPKNDGPLIYSKFQPAVDGNYAPQIGCHSEAFFLGLVKGPNAHLSQASSMRGMGGMRQLFVFCYFHVTKKMRPPRSLCCRKQLKIYKPTSRDE